MASRTKKYTVAGVLRFLDENGFNVSSAALRAEATARGVPTADRGAAASALPKKPRAKHECPHCGRGFTLKANMQRHIRSVHSDEKPFACAECGPYFTGAR